jgi:RNA polymerase sigma factor (sigma-70 family)
MGAPEPATLSLLRRWHAGDDEALASLLERHRDAVRALVHQRLGGFLRQREETDDFVQEAMLQVLRDGPRFQIADDRHFRLLLARIVENVIRDRHGYHTAGRRAPARERAISRESVLVLDPPRAGAATPSQITDQREQEAWVQLALELLEADDRRLIVAREWGDVPFAELGAELGTSEDAARMRHQRALVKLGRKVGELRRGGIQAALGAGDAEAESGGEA